MVLHFRYRKIEHIRRFNVGDLLEHRHQFGQVIKFRKACFCSVSCSFGCKFYRRDRLAKAGSPSVKVLQIVFLQCLVLQIPLNGIKLNHTVWNRRACRKHNATPSGDFIQISAFHKKIAGFLCFCLSYTTHISHFRVEIQIFIVVRLVDKKTVYTEFFKGYYIILSWLIVQLLQLRLQRTLCFFKLLDRKTISTVSLYIRNSLDNIIKLLL